MNGWKDVWRIARENQRSLYPGQREALTRRAAGQGNREIAEAMGVNRQTVVSYLGGARIALKVADVDQAVRRARAMGLIPFYRDR